jgi:hypothetical protein
MTSLDLAVRTREPVTVSASTSACVIDPAAVESIARAVASAVAKAPAASPAPANDSKAAPPAQTAEQAVALERARELVSTVLRRGQLTRADAIELRQQLAQANSPADAEEIRRGLIAAVNRRELRPDDVRLLFP